MKIDIHPAAIMVDCLNKYHALQETKLNGLIDNLNLTNLEVGILTDIMNTLSRAKEKDGKIDFSDNETMKRFIVHLHKNNPTIFGDLIHGFPDYIPEDDTPMHGSEMTRDELLERSLKNIDMSKITIEVLDTEMIGVVTQGIDGDLKKYSADLNQTLMKVNNCVDDKSQMTELGRKIVDTSTQLMESINRKMTGRG